MTRHEETAPLQHLLSAPPNKEFRLLSLSNFSREQAVALQMRVGNHHSILISTHSQNALVSSVMTATPWPLPVSTGLWDKEGLAVSHQETAKLGARRWQENIILEALLPAEVLTVIHITTVLPKTQPQWYLRRRCPYTALAACVHTEREKTEAEERCLS